MARNKIQQNSTLLKELSPAQVKVIQGLAIGENVTDAAIMAGVDRGTVYNWKRDPLFVEELNRTRAESRESIQAAFRCLGVDAIITVRQAMRADENPPALRLRAALAVLHQMRAGDPEPPETPAPAE